jgi:cation diffusion facilitator CzcD-associated flavoprotein CzcO
VTEQKSIDAVIVGAGFAGIYMLYKLRQQGLEARVIEAGSGVGGTWFWNRYPGARCDIPSMQYSYQFSEDLQQEWEWSEKYATQGEILTYAEHVVERFGLADGMTFNTRVEASEYLDDQDQWLVKLDSGEEIRARFVIMATGCLSKPNFPNIKGLDQATVPVYHTGNWPHEGVDFTGLRVGVIGTGSSAIQSTPIIADQAQSLTIFQRTPNYSIPAYNGPLDPEYVRELKARYPEYRQENWQRGFGADFDDNDQSAFDVSDTARQQAYEERWAKGGLAFLAAYNDLVFDMKANDTAREFFKSKISERVNDPALTEKLVPTAPIGCKRLCVDTDYYEIYNRDHVQLVDLNETPITEISGNRVVTGDHHYEVDALVLATGFDAMTGAVMNIDIRGKQGVMLQEKWAAGPKAYLGLATAGFPNLFLVTGPGSPSVLSNMLPSIEQHVEWISDCIQYMNEHQHRTIDPQPSAENEWVEHVNEVAGASVYPGCNSWYLGANVEGKTRVFMPYLGVPPYVEKCNQVVADGYQGFALSSG